MTEAVKDGQSEDLPPVEKRMYAEGRGRYSLVEGNKVYHFDFPINSSLEENYAFISHFKTELFKAIELKEKQEKEKSDKQKEVQEESPKETTSV